MLTSVGSALLGFGIILAILGFATLAIIVGVTVIAWEGFLFYRAGVS